MRALVFTVVEGDEQTVAAAIAAAHAQYDDVVTMEPNWTPDWDTVVQQLPDNGGQLEIVDTTMAWPEWMVNALPD